MSTTFPDGFSWGVATSAYQIEGGRFQQGKGESIWDRFADTGRMTDSGDVACDHFHRWRGDIALMAELGVTSYRFSTSWTRIVPDGVGKVNQAGLDFYSQLVDEMLAKGITPWLTLYHWDLPQDLQDSGGWLNRDTVDAFARYADVVSEALGDRVKNWITQNEPWVSAHLGHGIGMFAPGIADFASALLAGHHLLLSHGRAVPYIRANSADARVGIALDCRPSRPGSADQADIVANRIHDGFRNRWFLDPVFGRGYPNDTIKVVEDRAIFDGPALPYVRSGDIEEIAAPIDFLGLNYYSSVAIYAGDEDGDDAVLPMGPDQPEGYTEMGWEITPEALTRYLEYLNTEYSPNEIVITENGASYSDGVDADGSVHDQRRIDYLASHIRATADALDSGVPVRGYFVWSLLDNLEWVAGFSQRFGIVWVDHATGERIPKDSYRWFQRVIADGLPK
ncbi:MAG: GH1 family beta-glucosidase [Actinomycetota bacterium]|nr:GH1 family beta-glucosidase [Actinomycetota bacterium]